MDRQAVILWLIVINAVSLFLFWADKRKAVKNQWRIKESTLMFSAALGGCYGAWLGMRLFHHKTKKPLFYFGVPILALLWTAIRAFWLFQRV